MISRLWGLTPSSMCGTSESTLGLQMATEQY